MCSDLSLSINYVENNNSTTCQALVMDSMCKVYSAITHSKQAAETPTFDVVTISKRSAVHPIFNAICLLCFLGIKVKDLNINGESDTQVQSFRSNIL